MRGLELSEILGVRYFLLRVFYYHTARVPLVFDFHSTLQSFELSFCEDLVSKILVTIYLLTVKFRHDSSPSILGILKLMLYSTSSESGVIGQSCEPSNVY